MKIRLIAILILMFSPFILIYVIILDLVYVIVNKGVRFFSFSQNWNVMKTLYVVLFHNIKAGKIYDEIKVKRMKRMKTHPEDFI